MGVVYNTLVLWSWVRYDAGGADKVGHEYLIEVI